MPRRYPPPPLAQGGPDCKLIMQTNCAALIFIRYAANRWQRGPPLLRGDRFRWRRIIDGGVDGE